MAEALQTLTDKVGEITSNMRDMIPEGIREGEMTKAIESQTAKIPSVAFLNLAMGSIAISLGLAVFSRNKGLANFVGQWAPTFLLLGVYNKIVKVEGSDQQTKKPELSSSSSKKEFSSNSKSASSSKPSSSSQSQSSEQNPGLGTTSHGSQGTIKKANF